MRDLTQQRSLKELAAKFANEDVASWPASQSDVAAEAFYLRGRAYRFFKKGEQAARARSGALRSGVSVSPPASAAVKLTSTMAGPAASKKASTE